VFTVILSTFAYLVFEAPFLNLFKHFFPNQFEEKSKKYDNNLKIGHNLSVIEIESLKTNGKQERVENDENYNIRL
jgi:hypothetical protein